MTPEFIAAMNAPDTEQVIVALATFTNAAWGVPYRISSNSEITTSQSHDYIPMHFGLSLPSEGVDTTDSSVRFRADAVDRDIVNAIFDTSGEIGAEVALCLASNPDIYDIGPMKMSVRQINDDGQTLTGSMGTNPILAQKHTRKKFTPADYPGLFG